MEQKYDLNDICDEIGRILDNDITQTLRSTGCAVVGLANPAVGAVAGIGNDILIKYNKFKLSFLLRGYAAANPRGCHQYPHSTCESNHQESTGA